MDLIYDDDSIIDAIYLLSQYPEQEATIVKIIVARLSFMEDRKLSEKVIDMVYDTMVLSKQMSEESLELFENFHRKFLGIG